MKEQAIKLLNQFSEDKYTLQERKELAFKAVDKVITELMCGKYYEGIEQSFDKLNKIKEEIIKL